jgi:hypothetical protein
MFWAAEPHVAVTPNFISRTLRPTSDTIGGIGLRITHDRSG